MDIYTFWEPRDRMPYYLQLCIQTWKAFLPDAKIHVLDYQNIGSYIDIHSYGSNLLSGQFTMMQIADAIRALLLAQNGGVWMDADTICLDASVQDYFYTSQDVALFGRPDSKNVSIAVIYSVAAAPCMSKWVAYCKERIEHCDLPKKNGWAYLGNAFITPYVKAHPTEVKIYDIEEHWPELRNCGANIRNRINQYRDFYFAQSRLRSDLQTNMLMLHNSWTPSWFKEMGKEEFDGCKCTMANILKEALKM